MGYRQCLLLSVVHLKGKHCRKPHCRNGVVDTFEQGVLMPQLLQEVKDSAGEINWNVWEVLKVQKVSGSYGSQAGQVN